MIYWDMLGLEFTWQTQEYAPFIQHYYRGEGREFDLIAEGYLGSIKRVFSPEISAWRKDVKSLITARLQTLSRKCKTEGRDVLHEKIELRGIHLVPDVTWRGLGLGYILGSTSFFEGYVVDIEFLCCYCVYSYSGELKFSIKDDFNEPLDIPKLEVGGTPYSITAKWSESISGTGRLSNCP